MTTTPPRILVLGSANVDWMISLPRLPQAGETIAGDTLVTAPGGKGANQAVAAARLGAAVRFLGCVGDDAAGAATIAALKAEGIDVRHVRRVIGQPTGLAVVMTNADGENCIALVAGANAALSPDDVAACREHIESASLLVCQLESPLATVRAAVEMACAAHVPVLLNPAPAQALDRSLLRQLRFLVPNALEAGMLTGTPVVDAASAERAAHILLQHGVQTVVMTRGADGVLWAERDRLVHLPAPVVTAVDTTGAGDTFVGAFGAAWTDGRSMPEAIGFAQKAAAFSVQGRGAQASMPTRRRLD